MTDLRDAIRAATPAEPPTPDFDAVVAGRQQRRRPRLGVVAALAAIAAVTFAAPLARAPETRLVEARPPSTAWLLDTPGVERLRSLPEIATGDTDVAND